MVPAVNWQPRNDNYTYLALEKSVPYHIRDGRKPTFTIYVHLLTAGDERSHIAET